MTAVLIAAAVWLSAVPVTWVGLAARALMVVALFSAFWEHGRLILAWRINSRLAIFLIVVIGGALGAGAFAHGTTSVVIGDIGRQVYAMAFVIVLSQLCRDRFFLRSFIGWLALLAVVASIVLVYLQLSAAGLGSILDPELLKRAKYELHADGVALNSYSYSIAVAALLAAAMTTLQVTVRCGLLIFAIVVLWVFASLTTAAALGLAALGAGVIWTLVAGLRLPLFLVSLTMVACWLTGQFLVAMVAMDTQWLLDTLNELTTGRLYAWVVALTVFASKPIFGAGPFSWKEDLVEGVGELTDEVARYEQITGGAYHNVLFTTLAERGVVGGLALIILVGVVFYLCARSFRRRHSAQNGTLPELNAYALVMAVLMTLLRGLGEYSGPFAYANAHADFVALSIISILVATLRLERVERRLPSLMGGMRRRDTSGPAAA